MRLSITVLLSLSVLILCFKTRREFNSQAQLTNTIQDSISIRVTDNGSTGADLFVDPKTTQTYTTFIETQEKI